MRRLVFVTLALAAMALWMFAGVSAEGDVTSPVIGEDTTPEEVDSGEDLEFSVNVTDDVAVDRVVVEYWAYQPFFYENASMEADGDIFTYLLEVPGEVMGTLYYQFTAYDTSGNNATSEEAGVVVYDRTPPTGSIVATLPPTVDTGESYNVIVNVGDNVGVWTVTMYIYLDTGEGTPLNRTQTLPGFVTYFEGTVIMPTRPLGTLTHWMVVEDLSGNTFTLPEGESRLVDTIPPEIENMLPVYAPVGEEIHLAVEASDNIGVAQVQWKGLPFKAEGAYVNGSFDEPGEYKVTVTVLDAAGNEAYDEFMVYIEDEGGMWDYWLPILVGVVLAVVALYFGTTMMARKARETQGPDPELEDAPLDEVMDEHGR